MCVCVGVCVCVCVCVCVDLDNSFRNRGKVMSGQLLKMEELKFE